jgi:1,2-phenylacetyl-CoA epoxidase catalytic subunit
MARRRLHSAYTVSQNRWLIERLAYIEERMMTIQAGWLWHAPRLADKVELGRTSYEDAVHCDALRRRAEELAPPSLEPVRASYFDDLEAFCNEVANADGMGRRLAGLFGVLKPALLEQYRRHLSETDELIDAPTAAILRRIIPEEEEHIRWGGEALGSLLADPEAHAQADEWNAHLQAAWAGLANAHTTSKSGPAAYRNAGPPARHMSEPPARDEKFCIVAIENYSIQPPKTPEESVRQMLHASTHGELEAEEVLGRVLADAPELPWPMRLDLARQMWDEARHTELTWRRLEELGGPPDPLPPVITSVLSTAAGLTDPLDRLIALQRAVEGRASDLLHARLIALLDQHNDTQTARLVEYLIADERNHIAYSKWIDWLVGDNAERKAQLEQTQARAEHIYETIVGQARAARARAGVSNVR